MVQVHSDPPIFLPEDVAHSITPDGAIAQLGERLPCTQEVSSSILLSSTIFKRIYASVLKDGSEKNLAL